MGVMNITPDSFSDGGTIADAASFKKKLKDYQNIFDIINSHRLLGHFTTFLINLYISFILSHVEKNTRHNLQTFPVSLMSLACCG